MSDDRSLDVASQTDAMQKVSDVEIIGNTDTFQLLCKASSKSQGWMKSAKAMEIEGVGCIIQVTTQQDGRVAEALAFAPNTRVVGDINGGKRLVKVALAIIAVCLLGSPAMASDLAANDLALFAPPQLAQADLELFANYEPALPPPPPAIELTKADLSLFACDCGNCDEHGHPLENAAAEVSEPPREDSATYTVEVHSPTTWRCPACDALKASLQAAGVPYTSPAQEKGPVPRTVVTVAHTVIGNEPEKILRLIGKDVMQVTQSEPVSQPTLIQLDPSREPSAPVVTEYGSSGRRGFFSRVGRAIFGRRQSRARSAPVSSGYYGGACEDCGW